jgi:hypothetical protein
MLCAKCDEESSDGAQCTVCKKMFGFCCAGMTESAYRKRRTQWKCHVCRVELPASSATNEATSLESIMLELKSMQRHLASMPVLVKDVKAIKSEIDELKKACDFNSSLLDDHTKRLDGAEAKLLELSSLGSTIQSLNKELDTVKSDSISKDQWQRLNNVEIKGVPLKQNEDLFKILDHIALTVGYPIQKSSVNYISRVPIHNSKEKLIIVSFINRYVKEDFLAAARAKKTLLASEIGFVGNAQHIYLNDHLTQDYKKLLTSAKNSLKPKGYMFIWVKFGKIHVRKDDSSKVFIVNNQADLNRLL